VLLFPDIHPNYQGLTEPHCPRETLGDIPPQGAKNAAEAQQPLYAEP